MLYVILSEAKNLYRADKETLRSQTALSQGDIMLIGRSKKL